MSHDLTEIQTSLPLRSDHTCISNIYEIGVFEFGVFGILAPAHQTENNELFYSKFYKIF